MRKLILFLLITACSNTNMINKKDVNFDKELTFNEYIKLLNNYNKFKDYPSIK
jgi:hypothetical protein